VRSQWPRKEIGDAEVRAEAIAQGVQKQSAILIFRKIESTFYVRGKVTEWR